MSEKSMQQVESKQDDGFDGVRDKLRVLIKFHDTIGYTMHKVRSEQNQRAAGCPRDLMAEEMEASQHLVSCLHLIAVATTEEKPNQEEQQSSVSYLLAKEILEMAGRSNQIAEEFKARYTHLQAENRRLQEETSDTSSSLIVFFFIVAIYLYFR
ncbi:hypothetical protein V7S43_004341 [Phytophthora oleae]|uniref:Uncharacterized protein n=1 Tax=Phytophthora oleae TaxID=2107226 RepID=A0ABD3FW47_9STRA